MDSTRKYVLTVAGIVVALALLGWILFSDTEASKEPPPEDEPTVSVTT